MRPLPLGFVWGHVLWLPTWSHKKVFFDRCRETCMGQPSVSFVKGLQEQLPGIFHDRAGAEGHPSSDKPRMLTSASSGHLQQHRGGTRLCWSPLPRPAPQQKSPVSACTDCLASARPCCRPQTMLPQSLLAARATRARATKLLINEELSDVARARGPSR